METQNDETWNINCYLRDVAEEVAKYTFNHGKYPAIKFLEGYDVDEDTQIETNSNGVLNVYIPQNFNQQDFQQFQQALQVRIAEGSNLRYGGQAPCTVRVQQCSKEEAEKVQQNIHKWNNEYEKAYYRLIKNSDNDFYVMTCIAPSLQIKQQIQRQFEQSNGYYNGYYQTDAGEVNSSESLSKEDKYLTALKLSYIIGKPIIPLQNLPKPDEDDDEDLKKLYETCCWLTASPTYIQGMQQSVLIDINKEQFDLDEHLKWYAGLINDSARQQAAPMQLVQTQPVISQVPFVPANNVQLIQTPVPIYQGPVPPVQIVQAPATTTNNVMTTNTAPVTYTDAQQVNENNQYFIDDNITPEVVQTTTNANQENVDYTVLDNNFYNNDYNNNMNNNFNMQGMNNNMVNNNYNGLPNDILNHPALQQFGSSYNNCNNMGINNNNNLINQNNQYDMNNNMNK